MSRCLKPVEIAPGIVVYCEKQVTTQLADGKTTLVHEGSCQPPRPPCGVCVMLQRYWAKQDELDAG